MRTLTRPPTTPPHPRYEVILDDFQFSRFLEHLKLSTHRYISEFTATLDGSRVFTKDTAFHYRKHPSEDAPFPQMAPFLMLRSGDILETSRHDCLGELENHNLLSNPTHLEVRVLRWKPHICKLYHSAVRLEPRFSPDLDTEVKNPLLKCNNLIS